MNNPEAMSFSTMDASSLLRWIQDDAIASFGSNGNRWLRVIEVASKNTLRGRSPGERAIFREAALLALELAEREGALPQQECVTRQLRIRTIYMQRESLDSGWLEYEAASLFDLFSRSLPIDFASASRITETRRSDEDWRAVDPDERKALGRVKSFLKSMRSVMRFLDSREREIVQQWVDLIFEDADQE